MMNLKNWVIISSETIESQDLEEKIDRDDGVNTNGQEHISKKMA